MQGGNKEEATLEIADTLVPPPEASAAMQMMEDMKQETIMEEKDAEGLTDQEKIPQEEEEEYAIHIAGLSEEEDNETGTDKSPYFF